MSKNRVMVVGVFMASLMVISAVAVPLASSLSGDQVQDTDDIQFYEDVKTFYSDSFFFEPSTIFNRQLATLSVQMANHSIPLKGDGGYTEQWYKDQPNRLSKFLTTLGFSNFECNKDYTIPTTADTIGLGAAMKTITVGDKEYTLIAFTPRSGGYYNEWADNVQVGKGDKSDYMHEGWYNAANKAVDFIKGYIEKYKVNGDVKLWATGFSRGGAVTNLFAGLVDNAIADRKGLLGDSINIQRENFYVYTFEAPQGANIYSKNVRSPGDAIYDNIWNIINPNDIVPKVPFSQWGFTRFGTDLFVTTKFFDAEHFDENRRTVTQLYEDKPNSVKESDTLVLYEVNGGMEFLVYATAFAFLTSTVMVPPFTPSLGNPVGALFGYFTYLAANGAIGEVDGKGGYDANIVETLFFEELTKLVSRDKYCNEIQSYAMELMLMVQGYSSDRMDSAKSTVMGEAIAVGVLAVTLGCQVSMVTEAFMEIFNTKDLKTIQDALRAIGPILKDVYDERDAETISLIMNIENILENHDCDLLVRHMQAQDALYIDEYNQRHPNAVIKMVPLRSHADIARIVFDSFNQVKLYVGPEGTPLTQKNNEDLKVYIEGFSFGLSKLHKVEKGYAAGYYSYGASEKVEVFFHVDDEFAIEFENFSKKFWKHEMRYDLYYHHSGLTLNAEGQKMVLEEKLSDYSITEFFGSDTITKYPKKTAKEMLQNLTKI